MTYTAFLWTTLIVCTLVYRQNAFRCEPHPSHLTKIAATLHPTVTTLLVLHVTLYSLQQQASLITLLLHAYGTWMSILLSSLLLVGLPFPTLQRKSQASSVPSHL